MAVVGVDHQSLWKFCPFKFPKVEEALLCLTAEVMLVLQDKSSATVTPRNLKLDTLSTSSSPIRSGECLRCLPENQVVITAPLYQSLGFPPVCGLIICCDEAKYCCVVSKFYYEVRWRRGAVAVSEKCEEKWAEDATLRGPGVHGQGGGDVLANPDILCEVC